MYLILFYHKLQVPLPPIVLRPKSQWPSEGRRNDSLGNAKVYFLPSTVPASVDADVSFSSVYMFQRLHRRLGIIL